MFDQITPTARASTASDVSTSRPLASSAPQPATAAASTAGEAIASVFPSTHGELTPT
jgi:hypothetical protein